MSWIQKLRETYDANSSQIGVVLEEGEEPLLPIAHTMIITHVEVVLDENGNFLRANFVSRDDAKIVAPCTEKSASRTCAPEPHPLCDKIQYLAGDYKEYGGSKKSGYDLYYDLLSTWAESQFPHTMVLAIKKYVEKGCLIKDLIQANILFEKQPKVLEAKWDRKIIPQAPKNIKQEESVVRWVVENPDILETRIWQEKSLFEAWSKYYLSTEGDEGFCQIEGKICRIAQGHPKNINSLSANAKLISSNDQDGYTYRGRFKNPLEVQQISYEVSQKAHHALRWLIERQGYRKDKKVIVAWSLKKQSIIQPLYDGGDIIEFLENESQNDSDIVDTAQDFGLKLNSKIRGYRGKINSTDGIIIMELEAATDGRMAITYYKELKELDYIDRIDNWHKTCCWIHNYRMKEELNGSKKERKWMTFVGAPSPKDIAETVYGERVKDKLLVATIDRILSCIIDGRKIPMDIVNMAIKAVSNRMRYDEEWKFNKALSITCALINKYYVDYKKGAFTMALDETRNTRDYLYGRLLAVAQNTEQWALNLGGEKRQTNADRVMQRFSDHPFTTWRIIELSLKPYFKQLKAKGKGYMREKLLDEIMDLFNTEDFISDAKLSGEFLIGYHCQRRQLTMKRESEKEIEGQSTNEVKA